MDPNLHVVDLVRQRKQGFTELRRAGGVHDVVRDGIPFLGPAEESLVEFLVVILVVIQIDTAQVPAGSSSKQTCTWRCIDAASSMLRENSLVLR